jgi:hypothetical protein
MLYSVAAKSQTGLAVPKLRDHLDWLAQNPEEGQTFEEYVSFLTTRTTGRIRPIANHCGVDILLLPIIDARGGDCQNETSWSDYGPHLEH